MEKGRALFDASAYMLFEASGDSESKYFDDGALEELEYSDAAAEDDAQSCSYELVSDHSARVSRGEIDHANDDDDDDDFSGSEFDDCSGEEEEDGGGGGGGEEEGVVDQCRGGGGNTAAEKEKVKKSKICDQDSTAKVMNDEKERDKLFWEACLAS